MFFCLLLTVGLIFKEKYGTIKKKKRGILMVYYEECSVLIRDLEPGDAQKITDGEIAQGWHQSVEKYLSRLQDRDGGKCVSLVAEYEGEVAGYVNLYFSVIAGPYLGMGYPEIVDFGVLVKYRRRGIGGKLMDAVEKLAENCADTVTLSVGLHNGYGSAQRMYVKRGYLPDGTGAWYGKKNWPQYEPCCNDDDLVLYFSKKLK